MGLAAALALLAASAPADQVRQQGNLRVAFAAKLFPTKLPRVGTAPVAVSVAGRIETTDQSAPPQLRRIELAINRHGRLHTRGLPVCRYEQIQPATTAEARQACPGAVIGRGRFEADVALPDQSPFPSDGRVVAFNGRRDGRPLLLAHIYGTDPLPTSFTLPFELRQRRGGTYGTVLVARLPRLAARWGYVSGVSLTLQRRYRHRGKARSYLAAGCPAPRGFRRTVFPFARASFAFEGGRRIATTMTRSCAVRG